MLGVLAGEAVELGVAGDVRLDEVDAVVVVDRDIDEGDAAVDALGDQRALAGGDAVVLGTDRALPAARRLTMSCGWRSRRLV